MEGKPTEAPTTFRMRIGQHRRVTLPSQLLAVMGAQIGDTLVVDSVSGTFSFERQSRDGLPQNSEVGGTWEAAVVVSDGERMAGLPGKKQYQSDLTRLRQTVASYFAGLGVPHEILLAELEKVKTSENGAAGPIAEEQEKDNGEP